MGKYIFRLIIPLIVFLVILMDINRNLKVYSKDKKNILKFKVARLFVGIALLISLLLGIVYIRGKAINESFVYYTKLYNVFILIIYLVFIRFKRN